MRRISFVGFLILLLIVIPWQAAGAESTLDFDIPGGHFYKQANGQGGAGETGFAVTNEGGIPFWTWFQTYGGVANVGYPVSQRFTWKGFTVQAFQKVVFQWRPESKSVALVNVFDELSAAGKDDWLGAARSVPKAADWSSDRGKPWDQVVQNHYAILDQNLAIKQAYFSVSDPVTMNGLPMAARDYGNVFVVRAQRKVFQQWKQNTPWARAGEVTVANGGDLGKETSLYPLTAVQPTRMTPPPTSTPTRPSATGTTVYFFFSTSCEYCLEQVDEVERFHRNNPSARVVGVPLYASQSEARSWASRNGLTVEVRQDTSLVKALGSVSKHPVIAFHSTLGGSLTIASSGLIYSSALGSSYDTFVRTGRVTKSSGPG